MTIYISEESAVADIQKRFQEYYPHLRLVFYRNPHTKEEICSPDEIIPPDTPIDKIRMIHSFGWLDISYYRIAAAVEHDLCHEYGLNVHIQQQSGDHWESAGAGNTLEELNACH